MKKIIILLILLFSLSGCFKNNINSSVYISSIGFEIDEGSLVCYFLSNPLNNLSRNNSEGKDREAEYLKVEATNYTDAFNEAEKTLLSPLNYRHIKSVVFHKDLFLTDYIKEFFTFIRSGVKVSYNFYVFATEDKIEDIFKFKNPEQISYQHSILSSPNLLEFEKYGLEKMHFLDFANDFYEENRYLHVPMISVMDLWNKNKTLELSGYLSCKNYVYSFKNEDYLGMQYLKNQELIVLYTKEATYRIMGYKVKFKNVDDKFTINAIYKDVYIFGNGNKKLLEEALSLEIKKYLDDYIAKYGSLYLIDEYNYLNKKALNVLVYDLKIDNLK